MSIGTVRQRSALSRQAAWQIFLLWSLNDVTAIGAECRYVPDYTYNSGIGRAPGEWSATLTLRLLQDHPSSGSYPADITPGSNREEKYPGNTVAQARSSDNASLISLTRSETDAGPIEMISKPRSRYVRS